MNSRANLRCSFLTFLLLEIFLAICVNSFPSDTLNVGVAKTSATQKINDESTTSKYKFVNGKHSPITHNETNINENVNEVKDDEGFNFFPRGFLNWIYPNPSTLKQAFYRWFFNGIIMGGVFVQYDTVKRQILVTLSKVLTQWKKEKAERDKEREEAQLYDSNYNQPYGYPDGYQNQYSEYQSLDSDVKEEKPEYQLSEGDVKEEKPEYQPSEGDVMEKKPEYQPSEGDVKEEKPEYQPSEGDVKEEKPEYQPSEGDVKDEKSEYQPSEGDVKEEKPEYQPAIGDIKEDEFDYQQSSYTSNDYQLIDKRRQYFGEENSVKPKINSPRVKERLISFTNKVCFQKGLCQLEKLSSFSPSMASLWSEIRSLFSSSGANDHLPDQTRHLNCDKMFSSCHVPSLELIKFLLQ